MVHLTLAIADFMAILIAAALWAGATIGGTVLLIAGAVAATLWTARALVKRMLARRG
jgi:hypothetical protein